MRDGVKAFANTMSATAEAVNATWPNFMLPHFETQAHDVIEQTSIELLAVSPYVKHEERKGYESFVQDNYEQWVREAHMVRYGHLGLLRPFGFLDEIGYFDYSDLQNPKKLASPEREYYFPYIGFSPPPVSYVGLVSTPVSQKLLTMH